MNVRSVAVVSAAIVALTACGNGDAPEESATPTADATPSVVAEPTEPEQTEPAEQAKPKTRTYEVKAGDSLSVIAERFNTTVQDLVRLNNIDDKHLIREGQKLKVPAGG